jgi:hypothetical protein
MSLVSYDRCATIDERDNAHLLPAPLLRGLLLFDRIVINSARLREVPALVRVFGADGFLALLRNDVIRFKVSALSLTNLGQSTAFGRDPSRLLPEGSYYITTIHEHDRSQYVEDALRAVDEIPDTDTTTRIALRAAAEGALANLGETPIDRRMKPLRQLLLANHASFATALSFAYERHRGFRPDPSEFQYKLHPLNEDEYRLESNLQTTFGANQRVAPAPLRSHNLYVEQDSFDRGGAHALHP